MRSVNVDKYPSFASPRRNLFAKKDTIAASGEASMLLHCNNRLQKLLAGSKHSIRHSFSGPHHWHNSYKSIPFVYI